MLRSSTDGETLNLAETTVDIRGVCDEFTPDDRKDYEDLGETPPNETLEGWVYEQLNALTAEETKRLLDDVRNQPCNIMLIRDAGGREYESVKAR